MGNSTSNAANNSPVDTKSPSPRYTSPTRRTQSPGASPAPTNVNGVNRVHRSLRTKKKSLELPDLASLALTPALASPNASPHAAYRRPRASSPIPIPTSPNPPPPTFRVQNNLPSAAHIAGSGNRRYANKSYVGSAFPSAHSFTTRDRDEASPPREGLEREQEQEEPENQEFVPEVVHSTIPLALVKGDGEKPEHVNVTIQWRGGGKSVVLARAGDDYWKGRHPMDYDPETKIWSTQIHVLPGTHHFKFLVDDQWRTADEYPTAVDDLDGSLANYVTATSPNSISPSSSSPQPTPSHTHPPHMHSHSQGQQTNGFASFFSEASSSAAVNGTGKFEAPWTSAIPVELVHAAQEEENYLACADSPTGSSHGGGGGSVPAPNIPPAPVLPRHLDKLILNVRPQLASSGASSSGAGEREREREKKRERERRRKEKEGRARAAPATGLGMTAAEGASEEAATLPITTASGTDVSALMAAASVSPEDPTSTPSESPVKSKWPAVSRLDTSGLADDASVLPVPSHVVLHHLSTSAIRNGVLAVANTTRYKKKFITTIYYKPT